MNQKLHHEEIYRGSESMRKLAAAGVTICGAGALGSNMAVNLARQGFSRLTVIDDDRVETRNISTQIYSTDDVGGMKAEILKNLVFREIGEEVTAVTRRLTAANVNKLLAGAQVVIDAFDNAESRKIITDWCNASGSHCLHAGLNDMYGELRWNENYIVPSGQGEDICDYPMARNLITLVSSLACEILCRYLLEGKKENYSITFKDLKIHRDLS